MISNKSLVQNEMNITKIKVVLSLDVLLAVFFCIVPMVMYLNYLFKGIFTIIPTFALWLVYITSFSSNRNRLLVGIRNNQILLVLLLLFIGVNYWHYALSFDSDKARDFVFVSVYYFLFCLVGIYYQADKPKLVSIFFFITMFLGIQACISVPYLLSAENYVARMLSSGGLNDVESVDAMRHGLGTNGLYTSNVLIILLGIYFLKYFTGLSRIILLSSILAIGISVVMSTFFASVLLLVLGLCFVALAKYRSLISFKMLISIAFLVLGFIYFYDNFLSQTNLIRPLENKIERFSDQGGDVTGRVDLTEASINTFYNNPFFGIGVPDWQSYKLVGEHMIWLDLFAHYGFLGSLPLLIFLYLAISKRFVKPISAYYLSSVFVFVISNFISPMLVVANTFIVLLLFINKYETGQVKSSIFSQNKLK